MWSAVATPKAFGDTALRVARLARGAKAPSPLRSAGALHVMAVSRCTRGAFRIRFHIAIAAKVAQHESPMTALPKEAGAGNSNSPVEAFNGEVSRTKIGPLYSAGLGIVAFAMVLLPLIYIALIVLAAWLVLLHLKYDTWIFSGGGGHVFIRLIAYLGPAVAGGILVFFMIKPFFAAKVKTPEPITLDKDKEPLLFAFVQKICRLIGAPAPCRIDVDCQVNASASLRRGLWSKDLVLTIGLPLASGLEMRQFAGVLAHEFGHFAQGAGMRLTYIIRKINFWFARVVYERDEWDLKLEHSAKGTDWRIGIVLHAARGCVWLTRRILWALMQAGHAISCFMLRQMEYDADSYETKIAGSDAFEQTASRLRILGVATQVAYEDVRQSWASSRLPENLPLLIDHKANTLPAEIQQKVSSSEAGKKTGWFDTHPCDADRVKAARQLNEPGVFRLTEPAARLFSNFSELSKTVTRHQYEKHLELEFTEQNLMSAEEILRESTASAQADAMVRKYYGSVNMSLKPLLPSEELKPISPGENAAEGWRKARLAPETLRAEAEKISAECDEQHKRLSTLIVAESLAKAGFKLDTEPFDLPARALSAHEQEIAARMLLEETRAALSNHLTKLEPFMTALQNRVTLSLRLALARASVPDEVNASEITELARVLAAVAAEMPNAHDIASQLNAFLSLAQNRGNHSQPQLVDQVLSELSARLRPLVAGIQERLQKVNYPFPHPRSPLTVADYARYEKPAELDLKRLYLDCNAHVDRLFALHYRLVGKILVYADAAESEGGVARAGTDQTETEKTASKPTA
jgi:Zn-dependent protease with chaperone function